MRLTGAVAAMYKGDNAATESGSTKSERWGVPHAQCAVHPIYTSYEVHCCLHKAKARADIEYHFGCPYTVRCTRTKH